jgi:hypothetical protein
LQSEKGVTARLKGRRERERVNKERGKKEREKGILREKKRGGR